MWIIAAFFIGKFFFDLAKKNGKNPVAFAVIGILSYTVAKWIVDLLMGFVLVEYYDNWWFGWVSVPFAVFVVWIVYAYLKSSWQPKTRSTHKKKYDNRAQTSSRVSPTAAVNTSKINFEKPGHSEPSRSVSSQSTGRYNKNER